MHPILQRYHQVSESIAETAKSASRSADDVKLVVVTKSHPVESIKVLVEGGVLDLGENRVGEAKEKIEVLESYPNLRWHMIGHIQSRKAKRVGSEFHLVHSVDRVKLASHLDQSLSERGEQLDVLLQFNVSGEQSKSGWDASDPKSWEKLFPEVEAVLLCGGLHVRGLMTIAPYSSNPEDARPSFIRLRKLRDALAARFPGQAWEELSMGMSGDYQVAVEEGATIVRIGTAILGPRQY
jgi:pyridoxal phosphate enzyme (YggS family)